MPKIIVIAIPIIDSVPYKGLGEHKILLVKRLVDKGICKCFTETPFVEASEVVSKVIQLGEDRVRIKLEKAGPENQNRVDLKTGEGKYIDTLVQILTKLFCKKEFVFSSEKIN